MGCRMISGRMTKKGISTIISTILMVNIVLVMGVILMAWTNGLLGSFTGGSEIQYVLLEERKEEIVVVENVWFESVAPKSITVFVKNVGIREARIEAIYVEGQPFTTYNGSGALPYTLLVGDRACLKIAYDWTSSHGYLIVVATSRGNQARSVWTP